MKSLLIPMLVSSTLLTSGPASAAIPVSVVSAQLKSLAATPVGWSWRTPRYSVDELKSMLCDYGVDYLGQSEQQAEACADATISIAIQSGLVDGDGGGGYGAGFVLILVLFILLVIIGAGFGGGG